jgi:hypothetical protein
MGRNTGVTKLAFQSDTEYVYRTYAGLERVNRAQSLLMRVLSVGSNDDELLYSTGFPGAYEVVHHSVQGLATQRGRSGVHRICGGIYAIFYCGGAENAELGRQLVGEAFNDGRITAKGKVRAMLFRGADRYDETWVPRQ